MTSGVSGPSSLGPLSYGQQQIQQKQSQPPAKPPAPPGQDSVQLSNAAKGTGDVDHDGDSK
jgi:hypothetical protein